MTPPQKLNHSFTSGRRYHGDGVDSGIFHGSRQGGVADILVDNKVEGRTLRGRDVHRGRGHRRLLGLDVDGPDFRYGSLGDGAGCSSNSGVEQPEGRGEEGRQMVGIPETSGSSTGKRAVKSMGAGSGAGVQAGASGKIF